VSAALIRGCLTLTPLASASSLRRLRSRQLAADAALAHDDYAIAHAQDFRQLGGDHHDRLALIGQAAQQLVDFGLRADVDAAGRLVEEQNIAVARQPLGDDDLLLIASRQEPDFLRLRGRADVQKFHELLHHVENLALLQEETEREVFRQIGHHDIGRDIHADREAEALAILG
jgi:hypothetical protein